jgi:hypothetical protein
VVRKGVGVVKIRKDIVHLDFDAPCRGSSEDAGHESKAEWLVLYEGITCPHDHSFLCDTHMFILRAMLRENRDKKFKHVFTPGPMKCDGYRKVKRVQLI